jgi:dihydropteroate synthase
MGVINATHDSFYEASRVHHGEPLDERVGRMIAEGADIIDVGAESSRPGSRYVSADEEIERALPVIETIRRIDAEIAISIDTRKSSVARAALDAGATLINDISGLRDDPDMTDLAARRGVDVCIMHMRGTPETMQQDPHYDECVREVVEELSGWADHALAAGISRDRIILDPGIGFGKRFSDNWSILRNLDRFTGLGYRVLIGLSRKSFLGSVGGRSLPPEERLYATLAAELWCTMQRVSILRVHDVEPLAQMLDVLEAIADAE